MAALAIVAIAYLISSRGPGAMRRIGALRAIIALLQPHARAGGWVAVPPESITKDPLIVALAQAIARATSLGLPLAKRLEPLAQNLDWAHHWLKQRRRLLDILLTRSVLVSVMASVAAHSISRQNSIELLTAVPWTLALSASLITTVGGALAWHAGRPWPLKTPTLFTDWMNSLITDEYDPTLPYATGLDAIASAEWRDGATRTSERRRLLSDWALARNQSDQERLSRCEDLMPLWELLGAGSAVGLIFLEPILKSTALFIS